MNYSVGGQDGMRRVEEVLPALQTGDDGAGFLGDQQTGRQVPDLQAELPIAVEAPVVWHICFAGCRGPRVTNYRHSISYFWRYLPLSSVTVFQ